MSNELFICKICGEQCRSIRHLSSHIIKKEKIDLKLYFDTYMKLPEEGICPCCGKETKFLSLSHRYNKHCSKECSAKTTGEKNSVYMSKYYSKMKNRKLQSKRIKNSEKHKKSCSDVNTSIEFRNKMSKIRTDAYKNKEYSDKMNKASHNDNWKKSVTSKEFRENTSKNNTKRILEGKTFKLYTYDGHWFDSKPELTFYIWLKDHNVRFKHEKYNLTYRYNCIEYNYIPDFIVYNTFVEIKGEHLMKKLLTPNTKDNAKYNCMIENKVHIITNYYKYIKYVETKYGKNYMKGFKRND